MSRNSVGRLWRAYHVAKAQRDALIASEASATEIQEARDATRAAWLALPPYIYNKARRQQHKDANNAYYRAKARRDALIASGTATRQEIVEARKVATEAWHALQEFTPQIERP